MYLLGIDVGTTNTKAVIFDTEAGQVRAIGSCRTTTRHPRPEWSEFDADELWASVMQSLRQAIEQCDQPEQIRALAVSSMGESGFPLDAQGHVLYPAIAWHDTRSVAQAQWWDDTLGREAVYHITGQFLRPTFGVNKMLWLRDEVPSVFQHIQHWLSIEDFVLWKLSGSIATDYSVASRTMLFDQRSHTWSETLLKHAGISANWLPRAFQSGTPVGTVRKEIAEELKFSSDVAVVTGGHDHLCAALAAGMIHPGQILDSTGTASAVLVLSDRFQATRALLDAGYSNYAYVLPNIYVAPATIDFAGGALEWIVNLLYGQSASFTSAEETYAQALWEGAQVPIGSRGVGILPYFLGTGTPYRRDTARAHIFGLTASHGRAELVRALMEGLGFWLRDNLEVLHELDIVQQHPEIIAVGGGSRAAELMQIKADITGCRFKVPHIAEAAATGAALLAGIGVGAFRSADEAPASLHHTEEIYEPRKEAATTYSKLYQETYKPARRLALGD